MITRRISGPYKPKVELADRMVRFGIPCMLTTTPQLLNLRLDQLLMAALLPAHMLGLYAVAVAWSGLLAPCLTAVATVTFPRLASTHDTMQQVSTLGRILRLTILLAGGLVVGLLAVTPMALRIIFGGEFVSAIPAALLLVVASAIANLSGVIEEGLRGLGVPRWPMIAEFIGLVCTVVLLSLLLRPYQIMGAAAASLVSSSVILCVLIMGVVRTTGMTLKESLVPGREELVTIYREISALLARPAVSNVI
jgi:stage V sporulation protein B